MSRGPGDACLRLPAEPGGADGSDMIGWFSRLCYRWLELVGRSGDFDLWVMVLPAGDDQSAWHELRSAGHRAYVARGIARLEHFLERSSR